MNRCMVQRLGSHKEEGAKMIINMVLIALRKTFKCLSLTSSGQTTLKTYFINLACVLCLQSGAETKQQPLGEICDWDHGTPHV